MFFPLCAEPPDLSAQHSAPLTHLRFLHVATKQPSLPALLVIHSLKELLQNKYL